MILGKDFCLYTASCLWAQDFGIKLWNHNLRTSQLLSLFYWILYYKENRIDLSKFCFEERKKILELRGRRVRKIVILYSNKNKCQNKKRLGLHILETRCVTRIVLSSINIFGLGKDWGTLVR